MARAQKEDYSGGAERRWAAGSVYLPRTMRFAISTLAVLAGADFLQFGYAWLQEQEQEQS